MLYNHQVQNLDWSWRTWTWFMENKNQTFKIKPNESVAHWIKVICRCDCFAVDADYRPRSCSGGVSSCCCPPDVWEWMGVFERQRQPCVCFSWSCAALHHHSDHDPRTYTWIFITQCWQNEQEEHVPFNQLKYYPGYQGAFDWSLLHSATCYV